MYKKVLEDSGLKSGEAEIYNLLLQYGDSPASDITSKTKHKRGMVYKLLDDLKKRGLVSTYKKNKKSYFRPEHPQKLLNAIESNLHEARTQRTALESILPSLDDAYRMNQTRPVVKYYEGIEGIKKVFQDIYSPKEEPVYGCVDLEKADKALPSLIVKDLIPLRIKNKLMAITLIADSKLAKEVHKKDAVSYRESKIISKRKYPIPAEIDVYEDKVAMLSFDKEKFAGVIVQNKDIATSLKSLFKLAFENMNNKVK
jgi:sugar-specific transcriptional regulator TrmB